MAESRGLSIGLAPLGLFVAALLVRLVTDSLGFPFDGGPPESVAALIEHWSFYSFLLVGFGWVLASGAIEYRKSQLGAAVVLSVYMCVHYFEAVWPADGRAGVYAAPENLSLNILTCFAITGDAGVYQIVRVPVAALLLLVLVGYCGKWGWRVPLALLGLYLSGMLFTHPDAWQYHPRLGRDVVEGVPLSYAGYLLIGGLSLLVAYLPCLRPRWQALLGWGIGCLVGAVVVSTLPGAPLVELFSAFLLLLALHFSAGALMRATSAEDPGARAALPSVAFKGMLALAGLLALSRLALVAALLGGWASTNVRSAGWSCVAGLVAGVSLIVL